MIAAQRTDQPHVAFFALTLLLALGIAVPPSSAQTISNTPRPEMCVTDGIVYSILESCGAIHLGGEFSYVGRHSGSFVSIDATTGQPNPSMVRVLGGGVNASAPDGAGGWYIGGDFTSVGCITRNRLAHILADGSLDLLWDPNVNDSVQALAASGNTVYIGGVFTSVGGQTRAQIAAVNVGTGAVTGWNPTATGGVFPYVNALVSAGNVVYAGGGFSSIGGQNRNHLAALDANTGLATAWNPTIHGVSGYPAVWSIAVSGNTVYAGGSISANGSPDRNYLVALDANTGVATSWDCNVTGPVHSISVSGNTLYIGGVFNNAGGATRRSVAQVDATTGGATIWNPNPLSGTSVNAIAVSGNTIYLGGFFTAIGGQPRSYIAAVNNSSGTATPWNPGANDTVNTIAVSGSTVFAGGLFDSVGGVTRNNLAAIDPTTGEPTAWNPGANDPVYAMLRLNNTIYLSGDFTSVAGQTRTRLASVDATTGAVSSWNPDASGVNEQGVFALALSEGTMYVGGRFTSVGGQARNHIAAVDATTGAVTTWDPNATGGIISTRIQALGVSGNTVYVGGGIDFVGGDSRHSLAAFKITNADWADGTGLWNTPANWSPPVVPNNTACDQYNDRIAGAASQVTLDIDATVNTLSMEDNATLLVTAGDLTIASPEGIASGANIFVGPGHALIASTVTNVCGVSPIELSGTDAAISSTAAENTIRLSAPVVGFGVIDAAFQNESTIDPNVPGETLIISGTLSATSGGEMRASNNGTLSITRSITGGSVFVADGGIIDIPGATTVTVTGSTLNLYDGGELHTAGESGIVLTGNAGISCLAPFRGCIPPSITVTGNSGMNVGGDFSLSFSADVTVASTATFTLAGNFDNQSTSPTLFHWDAGPLTMNGAAPQDLEAAGIDYGDHDPAGYMDNFAVGTLRLEPGRIVDIRNNFPNQTPIGCEVLYVDTLSLGAGSTLRLHGCNVYYRTLIQEGGNVDTSNGGELRSALIGDLDCNGFVHGRDIQSLVMILTDPDGYAVQYPGCDANRADLNLNDEINMADVDALVQILLLGN